MPVLRKWLILVHRYLGIPLSLLFVVWFASGIVMMYTGDMPRLTPELRLERLADLDLAGVRLTPAEAVDRAGVWRWPGRATLLTVMERPAYRFDGATVFADTGELLGAVGVAEARTIASRFSGRPERELRYAGTLTRPDQWTLTYGRSMPLHKFEVDDRAGTQLYVSPDSAEVAMLTTRRSRALAWMGAIPHWFYFAALRVDQPLWYRIVVWSATLGCLLAVIGLVLGVTQFRWRRRPDARPGGEAGSRIPYTGWMRWHYLTGVVFGVVTLTWVFSGLLSMEPYAWTNARGLELPRDTFTGGPIDLARFPAFDAAAWDRLTAGRGVREVELRRIQDDPYYVVRLAPAPAARGAGRAERLHQPYYVTGRAERERLLVAADTLAVRERGFGVDSLLARLTAAVPEAPVVEAVLLDDYDSYYYSRGRQTPLPVLRVKLADPGETWLYIDPGLSRVLASVHRLNRVERWLFNGLHSLDFAFWHDRRPLWDIGVIALSLGGLASSGIGLWLGLRRMRRALGRMLPARAAAEARRTVPS